MKPFVIKNEQQYEEALAYVATLMDAPPGSAQEAELELWGTLVELYEEKVHPIGLPDPIEAIKFRMEQAGLTSRDLIPFLGSPSKVSEVLSRKRPLSIAMMRRLHEGLGIPAASLLGKADGELPPADAPLDWAKFPVVEMRRRGWIRFSGTPQAAREHAEELMRAFIKPFEEEAELPMCARQHVRDGKKMDVYALCAWKIRIMHLTSDQAVSAYVPGTVTQAYIQEVVRLSYLDEGPRLAREYLAKSGIFLVVEGHLSKTYLDGAALLMPDGHPLVALTLRYNRLDNFWFTLAHELAHVALHLDGENQSFFDDLEAGGTSKMEIEADRMASEALIPGAAWQSSHLTPRSTVGQIRAFAAEQRISPAIPAGRIRYEAKDHRLFWNLLGKGKVRVGLNE
ncbi:MAG: ImmA/IrrE family metallo-endopeptidase [bacterium]